MNKELIRKYVNYLNEVIKTEEDPDEAYELEHKRDDLIDILNDHNVYTAIEKLTLTCPDEELVGDYKCLGSQNGYRCFYCKECWKRILSI